jgi:SAM-dependent methyltransferase
VDVSPDQVALARQVVPAVDRGDALAYLEGHRDAFDLIVGLDIIEHFDKDEVLRFLDGCHSALRPGGRLILQTPNADSPWGTTIRYGDFTHEICFQHNSISRLLRLCGFEQIEVREQGPVPWGYSLTASFRWAIWQCIRFGLSVYNLAETGSLGSRIFTRVFFATGVTPRAVHRGLPPLPAEPAGSSHDRSGDCQT